jgi:hypothetical protein
MDYYVKSLYHEFDKNERIKLYTPDQDTVLCNFVNHLDGIRSHSNMDQIFYNLVACTYLSFFLISQKTWTSEKKIHHKQRAEVAQCMSL